MNIKQKLQNPFALVAQGFVAGAIILYATSPADVSAQSQDAQARAIEAGAQAVSSRA